MKTYSIVMLVVAATIEILALILFILKEINVLGFVLNVASMSLLIALVMMWRYKNRTKNNT